MNKFECPFCNNIFNISMGLGSISRHLSNKHHMKIFYKKWYVIFHYLDKKLLDKKLMYDLYHNKKMSPLDIANKFNQRKSVIDRVLFDYHKIKKKKHFETIIQSAVKRNKTNLERYGAINPLCKGTSPFKKRNKTVKEKYGVDNVFRDPDIIEKIKNSNFNGGHAKRIDKMKKLYGYSSSFQVKSIHDKAMKNNRSRISSLNKLYYNILNELNIEYIPEYEVNNYHYDIYLPHYNLIIELNGDYWHCNPSIYTFNYFHSQINLFAYEIWEKDYFKIKNVIDNKYNLVIIWESYIKENKNSIGMNLLKSIKSLNKSKGLLYENKNNKTYKRKWL